MQSGVYPCGGGAEVAKHVRGVVVGDEYVLDLDVAVDDGRGGATVQELETRARASTTTRSVY